MFNKVKFFTMQASELRSALSNTWPAQVRPGGFNGTSLAHDFLGALIRKLHDSCWEFTALQHVALGTGISLVSGSLPH